MIKQIIAITVLAFSFVACNSASKQQSSSTDTMAATHTGEDMHDMKMDKPADKNAITDPVCGMEKDNTWTDYTIYKGDTVWFCSTPEKDAFLANPAKYEHNLPHH